MKFQIPVQTDEYDNLNVPGFDVFPNGLTFNNPLKYLNFPE
jgi:hypothetical protein